MSVKTAKVGKSELIVQLTENYRLVSDGIQYIVEERVTVDPTTSPTWPTRLAKAKAEGKPEPDGSIRKEWRVADGPYYPRRDDGLIAAINSVKHRAAISTLDHVSLTEFTDFIREQAQEMTSLVVGSESSRAI